MAELPEPPSLPRLDEFFSIHNFIRFWTQNTFGLFPHMVAVLLLATVWLKTRSIPATVFVGLVLMSVSTLYGWLAFPVAAGMAWIVYRVFYKRRYYD